LKLDFLFAASLPGVAYNRRLSPYERYRTGIEFIRKIVGKNVFLLGCGAPLIPSIGVFDGMRIGCDVTPFWGAQLSRRMLRDKHALCTEKALINTLTRNPMHRNFWLNDPDCLIVRQDKNKMNYDQTILMATVMSLSGGILLVSDNLSTITSDRIDLLLKAISLSKQCQKKRSYTLGIFENSFPRGIMNESGIIGIWNPTKETEIIELDLPFKVKISDTRDYWTGDIVKDLEIDSLKKTLRIKLEPFKSVVLGVK
jgi:alpha-galactosidase